MIHTVCKVVVIGISCYYIETNNFVTNALFQLEKSTYYNCRVENLCVIKILVCVHVAQRRFRLLYYMTFAHTKCHYMKNRA